MNHEWIQARAVLRPVGRLAVTVAGCAWLLACASAGTSTYSLSDVDVRPELRGCGSYTDPPSGRGYHLEVSFVVDTAGAVEPASITVMSRRQVGRTHSEEMVRRAKRDAEECRFSPALIDGEPVPVRTTKRFYYPDQG